MSTKETAKVQPRIYSAPKVPLQERVPLQTPFSAHIDVCSVCNFKCSFCFQADNKAMKEVGLKRGMMPIDLFTKIVDDLKEFPEKLKKVKIGNHGEPTLHPDLPLMIKYVKESGVAELVEVFTNGSKLEPNLNDAMVEAGLDRINISLEGLSDKRYKEVAGAKVDFQEIVDGVRDLYAKKESAGSDLKIYVKIADQTSALDKGDTRLFILDEKERSLFFDLFSDHCDEIFIEKVVPQWAEVQLEKQNDVNETGMYGQKIKQYKEICPFVFMYLHFNWDGTTSPCTLDWPKKVVVGNVKENSVKEIWHSERWRKLQIAMLNGDRDKIDFCRNCSAPMVCVDEDLDPFKKEVLDAMSVSHDEAQQPNEWIIK